MQFAKVCMSSISCTKQSRGQCVCFPATGHCLREAHDKGGANAGSYQGGHSACSQDRHRSYRWGTCSSSNNKCCSQGRTPNRPACPAQQPGRRQQSLRGAPSACKEAHHGSRWAACSTTSKCCCACHSSTSAGLAHFGTLDADASCAVVAAGAAGSPSSTVVPVLAVWQLAPSSGLHSKTTPWIQCTLAPSLHYAAACVKHHSL